MGNLVSNLKENRRRVIAVGVVILIAVILFVLLQKKDDRLDAIRRAGYPVTVAELNGWYTTVPTNENAALIYLKAFSLLPDPDAETSGTNWIPDLPKLERSKPLPEEISNCFATMPATGRTAISLIHSATNFSRSRYPVDLAGVLFEQRLPHFTRIKQAIRLLVAEATLQTASGRSADAINSFRAAGHMTDSLSNEPTSLSQLVRSACWHIIFLRMEWVINNSKLSDAEFNELQLLAAGAERQDSLERAMAGERALQLSLLTDTKLLFEIYRKSDEALYGQPKRLQNLRVVGTLKLTGVLNTNRSHYLESMAAIIQAAQKPFPQRFAECKQAHAAASAEPSSSHGFSWLALYLLPTDFERDANQAARTRVTVTALAVQRFRLAHQQALPEKLDDLVPTYLNSVPIDPFDGKALRFKKLEKGFVIYSVGKDGQDNDDAEFDSNNREAPIDVTFTVER